jgi:serine/threonine-protein kinase
MQTATNPLKESCDGYAGLAAAAQARVGGVLAGRWRLDALLGLGGMAAVYAATHRNGNRVALKVLHAHYSLDEGVSARLEREGYVANLVDHPGAVRVLDDGRAEDGAVFLVMELLDGEALDVRLARRGGRLDGGDALAITYQLLEVLAAAHAKGIVHRDIKPDNVFITRAGEVKVLDFGTARLVELPAGHSRTRNGALFGTPGFMAPEQALGHLEDIDAQTDLWAVGATLFALVSGRPVHRGTNLNEQLVEAATQPAPALASVLPGVDAALAALVDTALAFDKAERWPTARRMQDAVRAVAEAAEDGVGALYVRPPSFVAPLPPARAWSSPAVIPAPPPRAIEIGRSGATVTTRRRRRLLPVLLAGGVAALWAGNATLFPRGPRPLQEAEPVRERSGPASVAPPPVAPAPVAPPAVAPPLVAPAPVAPPLLVAPAASPPPAPSLITDYVPLPRDTGRPAASDLAGSARAPASAPAAARPGEPPRPGPRPGARRPTPADEEDLWSRRH